MLPFGERRSAQEGRFSWRERSLVIGGGKERGRGSGGEELAERVGQHSKRKGFFEVRKDAEPF